jgi:hypothetical protein
MSTFILALLSAAFGASVGRPSGPPGDIPNVLALVGRTSALTALDGQTVQGTSAPAHVAADPADRFGGSRIARRGLASMASPTPAHSPSCPARARFRGW